MKELSEFDSLEFKRKADEYWAEPMCECDDAGETPDGKAGWYCEGCEREIPAREAQPVCDFGNRREP